MRSRSSRAAWTIGARHQLDEPTDDPTSVEKIKRDSFGGAAVDIVIAERMLEEREIGM